MPRFETKWQLKVGVMHCLCQNNWWLQIMAQKSEDVLNSESYLTKIKKIMKGSEDILRKKNQRVLLSR